MNTKNSEVVEKIEKEIEAINLLCTEAISKLSKLDTEIIEAENAARTARANYDQSIDDGDGAAADACLAEIKINKRKVEDLRKEQRGPELFNLIRDLTARKERVISQARENRAEKDIAFNESKSALEKASALVDRVVHTLQPAINQIREKLEEKKSPKRRDEISPEKPGTF